MKMLEVGRRGRGRILSTPGWSKHTIKQQCHFKAVDCPKWQRLLPLLYCNTMARVVHFHQLQGSEGSLGEREDMCYTHMQPKELEMVAQACNPGVDVLPGFMST